LSRRRSPGHRDGLWDWTDPAAGDIRPAEVRPNPLLVICPVGSCGAGIGEKCVRPGRRGRVDRKTPHPPRLEDAARAAQADQEPIEQPPSSAAGARTDRS